MSSSSSANNTLSFILPPVTFDYDITPIATTSTNNLPLSDSASTSTSHLLPPTTVISTTYQQQPHHAPNISLQLCFLQLTIREIIRSALVCRCWYHVATDSQSMSMCRRVWNELGEGQEESGKLINSEFSTYYLSLHYLSKRGDRIICASHSVFAPLLMTAIDLRLITTHYEALMRCQQLKWKINLNLFIRYHEIEQNYENTQLWSPSFLSAIFISLSLSLHTLGLYYSTSQELHFSISTFLSINATNPSHVWIPDLTMQGIEPNPGPTSCEMCGTPVEINPSPDSVHSTLCFECCVKISHSALHKGDMIEGIFWYREYTKKIGGQMEPHVLDSFSDSLPNYYNWYDSNSNPIEHIPGRYIHGWHSAYSVNGQRAVGASRFNRSYSWELWTRVHKCAKDFFSPPHVWPMTIILLLVIRSPDSEWMTSDAVSYAERVRAFMPGNDEARMKAVTVQLVNSPDDLLLAFFVSLNPSLVCI